MHHLYAREITIKKAFKNLSLEDALACAKLIDDSELSLSPSFMHRLIAHKLTKLFIKHNPLDLTRKLPEDLAYKNKASEALSEKIRKTPTISRPGQNVCHPERNPVIKMTSDGPATVLYIDESQKNLFYYAVTMQHPLIFKSSASINWYTMNNQANKIIAYTSKKQLLIWDKKVVTAQDKEQVAWIQTVLDEKVVNYAKIIFSKDDSLFISIDQEKEMTKLKVWNAISNSIVAQCILAESTLTTIDFFANNRHILIRSAPNNFKIFDIVTQSIIEQWQDDTMITQWRADTYQVKKSPDNDYYLTRFPPMIYNHFHQKIIKFNPHALSLPLTIKSLWGDFTNQDILVVGSNDREKFFNFNIPALNLFLQQIDKLTLVQAIVLRFYKHHAYKKSLKHLIETMPQSIKDIVRVA